MISCTFPPSLPNTPPKYLHFSTIFISVPSTSILNSLPPSFLLTTMISVFSAFIVKPISLSQLAKHITTSLNLSPSSLQHAKSSAYAKISPSKSPISSLTFFITTSRYDTNKIGDNKLPCLTPVLTSNHFLFSYSVLTLHLLFLYKLSRVPLNFLPLSLIHISEPTRLL